jgi:hypothetical protein
MFTFFLCLAKKPSLEIPAAKPWTVRKDNCPSPIKMVGGVQRDIPILFGFIVTAVCLNLAPPPPCHSDAILETIVFNRASCFPSATLEQSSKDYFPISEIH